jgi:hypothetical protein
VNVIWLLCFCVAASGFGLCLLHANYIARTGFVT